MSLEAQGGVSQQRLQSQAGGTGLVRGCTLSPVYLWGAEGREGLRPENGGVLGQARTCRQPGEACSSLQ